LSIFDLKVYSKNKELDLPDWIKFAFSLGGYINDINKKESKKTNVLISLPTNDYFPLFVSMGIADKYFSDNKQIESIKKAILGLEKGNRILYKDNKSIKKVSVISIEPSPVFSNQNILKISVGNVEYGIPENQWVEKIQIIDEEYKEIKRTRKIANDHQIGLKYSPLLKSIYTEEQLKKVEFFPGDYFYIIGNKDKLLEQINEEIFTLKKIKGGIKDFLYLDLKNSYTNGKIFSSKMRKLDSEINENVPVIFSDITSFNKQSHLFFKNPKVIITSRSENEIKFYELIEEIKRRLLLEKHQYYTYEILEYTKIRKVKIPNGTELIIWR